MSRKREGQARSEGKGGPITFPVPFEEAVADLLKVKPPPEKKKRGRGQAVGQEKPEKGKGAKKG